MAVDEGTATLQRLRGQNLVVPDLERLFAQLEQGTNPHRARLTEAINSELDGLGLDPDYIERVKSIDVALFTSL